MPKIVVLGPSKLFKILLIVALGAGLFLIIGVLLASYKCQLDLVKDEIARAKESDPDKALPLYDKAFALIAADKNSPPWMAGNLNYEYGRFLREHGRVADGLNALNAALSSARTTAPPAALGNIVLEVATTQLALVPERAITQADIDQLIELCKSRSADDANDAGFWNEYHKTLAEMYVRTGQNEKAHVECETGVDQYREDPNLVQESRAALMEMLIILGRYDQANQKYVEYAAAAGDYMESYRLRYNFRKSLKLVGAGDSALNQPVLSLLERGDYTGLDALAERLADDKKIYSSGKWSVTDFYKMLDSLDAYSFKTAWQTRVDQLAKWQQSRPDSAPAKIAYARVLSAYAWKARESNWDGEEMFAKRQSQAKALLDQVKDRTPGWYASMQRVVLGLNWSEDQYNAMVAECRKNYPSYDVAVFDEFGWYQLGFHPGNDAYGNHLLAESKAVQASRKGDAGDILYARAIWCVDDTSSDNFLQKRNLEWRKIKSGLLALAKQYPKAPIVRGMLSTLAMEKGDRASAEAAFK